jgi:hypothetical protein
MAEWTIATVLKTVEAQASGGSNPPPSATTFDVWWTGVIIEPVADRLAEGVSSHDATDAIGIVADVLLRAPDGGTWTADHRHRLSRALIEPLIA